MLHDGDSQVGHLQEDAPHEREVVVRGGVKKFHGLREGFARFCNGDDLVQGRSQPQASLSPAARRSFADNQDLRSSTPEERLPDPLYTSQKVARLASATRSAFSRCGSSSFLSATRSAFSRCGSSSFLDRLIPFVKLFHIDAGIGHSSAGGWGEPRILTHSLGDLVQDLNLHGLHPLRS